MFRDLRGWIQTLEKEGELKRIKEEVNWNREIGAVTRKVFDKNGPALLFENIKGYNHEGSRCKRLFTGGLATFARCALMLGLPKNTPVTKLIQKVKAGFRDSLKPMEISSGPVKENILMGEKIDLYDFPVPLWHPMDGGRYINTFCGVVTKDPETGHINVGLYRGMLKGKKEIAVPIVPSQHWGLHYKKYKALGRPMPVAVVIGWEPLLPFLAASGIPYDKAEYDVMGALRGEPMPLVRCQTNDLLVPAYSEIVLEGIISLDKSSWTKEGPFGEYTGYYGGEASPKPLLKVECVTHRSDPIFRGTLEGMGPGHPNEDGIMMQLSVSALAWNALETAGIPGIKDVYSLPASCATSLAVQIHKTYLGQAKQVALAVWGSGLPMWLCKYVIVVEEDIDIHDFTALEWAIAYRVNPGENDLLVVPGTHGSPLDPSIRMEERDVKKLGTGKWNRLLIDATKNWEYEPQEQYGNEIYPPVAFKLSKEDEELVERRWKEYGID